jgi:hypothetical protein
VLPGEIDERSTVVGLRLFDPTSHSDPARALAYSSLGARGLSLRAKSSASGSAPAIVARSSAVVAPPPLLPSPTIRRLDVASPVPADFDIANSVFPLPMGEGKSITTVGLCQALRAFVDKKVR